MERALGPVDVFGNLGPGILLVAALAEHPRTVGILEFDAVVIEDFAIVARAGDLRTAHAVPANGMVALEPINDIQIVNVLLDDVIAADPDEVIPVTHLVLHFAESTAKLSLQFGAPMPPGARSVPIGA